MHHSAFRIPHSAFANRSRLASHNAFTLLEVILALGVLATALAIVGEVTSLSYRNADRAAREGEAMLIAESVMAQLTAGVLPVAAVPPTEWTTGTAPASWRYEVLVEPSDLPELLTVRVRVEPVDADENDPLGAELVRWMLDPAEEET
ncbi:MAG: prepilin-type N-terminal cleavage/methylation domain-containing protein [Planctomycetota bacterium]